jgi:hypothetical protein
MDNIPSFETFQAIEAELHEGLRHSLRLGKLGLMVHHPLVISMFVAPGMMDWVNKAYLSKVEHLAEAFKAGEWHTYVWLHERPYRVDALTHLMQLRKLDLDAARAWKLIGDVWIDSENVQQHDRFWKKMWKDPRARMAMDAEEVEALAALPDPVPVWHGLERKPKGKLGFSWTTVEHTAQWFAQSFATRHKRPAYVASGSVPKSFVCAYLLGRSEFEIIAFPDHVEGVTITPWTGHVPRPHPED